MMINRRRPRAGPCEQSRTRQVKKRGKTPTRPNTPNGSKITTCSPRSQNAKANADVNFADRARIASHSKREWRASELAKKEEASDVKDKESGDAPGKETKTGASPYPQKLLKTLFGSSISAGCMSERTNRFNPCGKGRDAPVKKRKPTRPRFYGIVGDAPVRGKPKHSRRAPHGFGLFSLRLATERSQESDGNAAVTRTVFRFFPSLHAPAGF